MENPHVNRIVLAALASDEDNEVIQDRETMALTLYSAGFISESEGVEYVNTGHCDPKHFGATL